MRERECMCMYKRERERERERERNWDANILQMLASKMTVSVTNLEANLETQFISTLGFSILAQRQYS
jgi:hypothetical protein